MTAADPWPTIHSERAALAADLETLSPEQWSTASLCPGWSVHDALGHMTATAKLSPAQFFVHLAGSGFRFNTMAAKDIARETAGTPAQTLVAFRGQTESTTHPPGPNDTWLGEVIVHSQDIRRPLGIAHTYPMDAVTRVASFYSGSNLLIGSKRRISGLTLRATDADWTTGDGPEVTGPALSLLLAMTGRAAALDDLSGEGLETLRGR